MTGSNRPAPDGAASSPRPAGRCTPVRGGDPAGADRRHGFTFVELLVTMVILSIVTSLSAVGLAGIRTGAKVAKTRSTIRKLHEVVVPAYLQYLDRRVDDSMWIEFEYEIERSALGIAAGSPRLAAWKRLVQRRGMLVHEMPDQWVDVRQPDYPADPADPVRSTDVPAGTPVIDRYLRYVDAMVDHTDPSRSTREQVLARLGRTAASAETLHLFVALGGFETDALEPFRDDEIGDVDGDGAPEFLDGFGRPIHFLRWAPGAAQALGVQAGGDPFDPYRLGGTGTFPLTPLIVSAGPDERISIRRTASRSIEEQGPPRTAAQPGGATFLKLPFDPFSPPEAGMPGPTGDHDADNITNFGMSQP